MSGPRRKPYSLMISSRSDNPIFHPPATIAWRRLRVCLVILAMVVVGVGTATSAAAAEDVSSGADSDASPIAVANVERTEPVDFEREILPILRRNCLACHNEADAEAGLVLETPGAIRRGGDSGEAVTPGNAEESLLFSVSSHRDDPVMPPEDNEVEAKNLTPAELGLLKLWIDQGAQGEVGRGGSITLTPPPATLRPVFAVAVMPQGDYVAAGRANQINVYHLPTQQLVANLSDPALDAAEAGRAAKGQSAAEGAMAKPPAPAHIDLVQSLAASGDGETLASGGFRTVKIWRRQPPRRQSDSQVSATAVTDVHALDSSQTGPTNVVSPDGKFRVTIGEDGIGHIYDADGKSLVKLQTNLWQQRAVDDARRLVAVAERVLSWSEYDRNEVAGTVKRAEQKVKSLGQELQKLIDEGKTSTDAEYQKSVDALAFRATDLKQLAAAVVEAEQVIGKRREQLATAQSSLKKAEDLAAAVPASLRLAAFRPDSKQLAAADNRGRIHTFAVPSGAPIDVVTAAEKDSLTAIAYAANGQLVTRATGGEIQVWQPAQWSHVRTIGAIDSPETLIDRVTALAFSPDGRLLATGGGETSRSGELKIWDVATGELVRSIDGAHSDTVLGIEFSHDGVHLASCGSDRNMRVFVVATGKRVQSFEYHTSYVLGVSWRADGRVLATAGADNVVRVWNFKTGNEHKVIRRFDDKEVTGIQFLGNSGDFVVSAANNAVSMWNYNGGGGRRYDGVTSFMYAIGASANGVTIAAGGHDGIVHVWNCDGKRLAKFE